MTKREWEAAERQRGEREDGDRIVRFLDRWTRRLTWAVIIATALWFGGGFLMWKLG